MPMNAGDAPRLRCTMAINVEHAPMAACGPSRRSVCTVSGTNERQHRPLMLRACRPTACLLELAVPESSGWSTAISQTGALTTSKREAQHTSTARVCRQTDAGCAPLWCNSRFAVGLHVAERPGSGRCSHGQGSPCSCLHQRLSCSGASGAAQVLL